MALLRLPGNAVYARTHGSRKQGRCHNSRRATARSGARCAAPNWAESDCGRGAGCYPSANFVRRTLATLLAAATTWQAPVLPPAVADAPAQTTAFDRGVERCTLEQLKKGADTRAAFSDFAGEPELLVNIEGCDYSNKDLRKDVLSGVRARGASFREVQFGREASRADFRGADLRGASFRGTNLYETLFQGANLAGASFEGALCSSTRFGYDEESAAWANLEGASFEDALLSASDVKRLCENPTILEDDRAIIGCRD